MTWLSNFFESYALCRQSRGSFDALLIGQEEAARYMQPNVHAQSTSAQGQKTTVTQHRCLHTLLSWFDLLLQQDAATRSCVTITTAKTVKGPAMVLKGLTGGRWDPSGTAMYN